MELEGVGWWGRWSLSNGLLPGVVAAVVAYGAAWLLIPPVLDMLRAGNLVRPNYLEQPIPVAAGLVFPLAVLPALLVWRLLVNSVDSSADRQLVAAGLSVLGFALLGLLDDSVGSGRVRGLRGHLRALSQGELTTGAVKAGYGLILALILAWIAPNAGHVLVSTLLVSLSANTINLFDLRPGRALKVFICLFAGLAAITRSWGGPLLILPAAAIAFLPWDLQARAMLGDTGANVLGAWLGLFLATAGSPMVRLIAVFMLIGLHYYAEKRSLSTLIADVPALAWFDRLGRGG